MAECSELFADRSLYHKKTFRGFPAKVIPMKQCIVSAFVSTPKKKALANFFVSA